MPLRSMRASTSLKQQNLSTRSIEVIRDLRTCLDEAGAHHQKLLVVGDNSFCNRTLFLSILARLWPYYAQLGDCAPFRYAVVEGCPAARVAVSRPNASVIRCIR